MADSCRSLACVPIRIASDLSHLRWFNCNPLKEYHQLSSLKHSLMDVSAASLRRAMDALQRYSVTIFTCFTSVTCVIALQALYPLHAIKGYKRYIHYSVTCVTSVTSVTSVANVTCFTAL
jgi:hypothetical protein